MTATATASAIPIPHVVKGVTVGGAERNFSSAGVHFATPALDLDALVWPRPAAGPAFETPLAEIIDVLTATGERLTRDPDGQLARALEFTVRTSPLPRGVLERSYAGLGAAFNKTSMNFQIEQELGGAAVLEGWREVVTPKGKRARVRAFPARLLHIIAGNAPGVAAMSIIRGALTKAVNLIKIPSNDLFTATAILEAMAKAAPGHPVTRSFSAVYWRGGDAAVESMLFRAQFFDKLVAWGGESTIRSAKAYIGPGFELVSFDPKTSISMIGREIFASEETLKDAAERGAIDATVMNQQACASSRFQFIEGSAEEIDRYCALLQEAMGVERQTSSAVGRPLPGEMRDEIEGLRSMEPYYRVFGRCDGRGLVIRSEDPVDFHPDGKVVNVVPVKALADAIPQVNVATQTVGIYPASRKPGLRNALAAAGAQRIVTLGEVIGVDAGLPHDGFLPLQRFVRWVTDEG